MLEEIKDGRSSLHKFCSIRKAKDFAFLKNNSKVFYSREITILSGSLAEFIGGAYLGFKISKKVGNAVRRNKLRRRIKAIMRVISLLDHSLLGANQALVFIPNKNIVYKKYSDIKTLIIKALSFLHGKKRIRYSKE